MIQRNAWLRYSTTLATALVLVLIVGCAEQPTEALLRADGMSAFTLGDTGVEVGETNSVTPSTNEENKDKGWAYVEWNSNNAGVGEAPLKFVSTRGFYSCFEYRIDDEPPTREGANYNTLITDGLWDYVCVNNSEETLVLTAERYVDVRMVFGAESDERFDWTRFFVKPAGLTKADCKDSGWKAWAFRNQGQCVRFVETGKDSRESGIFGTVIWTSGPGDEGLWTALAANATTQAGTVWFNAPWGNFTMRVECVAVDGDEGWAGGTVCTALPCSVFGWTPWGTGCWCAQQRRWPEMYGLWTSRWSAVPWACR